MKTVSQSQVRKAIKKNGHDPRLEIINEFDILVPKEFSLDAFIKEREKEELYQGIRISDYFKEKKWSPSGDPKPGKKKTVKVVKIVKSASSQACVDFVESHPGGILPNARGLAIIWQEGRVELPREWTIGFDIKNVLPVDADGDRLVPYLRLHLSLWDFGCQCWSEDWFAGNHFIFFCDKRHPVISFLNHLLKLFL